MLTPSIHLNDWTALHWEDRPWVGVWEGHDCSAVVGIYARCWFRTSALFRVRIDLQVLASASVTRVRIPLEGLGGSVRNIFLLQSVILARCLFLALLAHDVCAWKDTECIRFYRVFRKGLALIIVRPHSDIPRYPDFNLMASIR